MKFDAQFWLLVCILQLNLLFHFTFCKPANKWKERIVNGKVADEGQFPYHVGIYKVNHSVPFCGGALISNQFVLTAAHCFDTVSAKNSFIRMGIRDLTYELDTERNISSIHKHPDYEPSTYDNDIALLKLSDSVVMGPKISNIPLVQSSKQISDTKCVITGWGQVGYNLPDSPVLLHASVSLYPHDLCKYAYKTLYRRIVTDNMLCYGGCKSDACKGDSGGPLACREKDGQRHLVGITSIGPDGCGIHGIPGAYTKVANYITWIESVTGK